VSVILWVLLAAWFLASAAYATVGAAEWWARAHPDELREALAKEAVRASGQAKQLAPASTSPFFRTIPMTLDPGEKVTPPPLKPPEPHPDLCPCSTCTTAALTESDREWLSSVGWEAS